MPLNDILRQRMQPLTAAMTSNRIILYAIFSTGAMFGAILNACRNQSNFYAVTVYLSRSGRSLLVSHTFWHMLYVLKDLCIASLDIGQLWFLVCTGMWKDIAKDILWAVTSS